MYLDVLDSDAMGDKEKAEYLPTNAPLPNTMYVIMVIMSMLQVQSALNFFKELHKKNRLSNYLQVFYNW